MRKKLFLAFAFAIMAAALPAFQGDYGTQSVFTIGAGARSAGMGNAYTAISDDASGAAFNPAGAVFLPRQQAFLLYYPLYGNTVMNTVFYGVPILDFGTIEATFYRVSTDKIKGYDSADMALADFSYGEYKVSVIYAKLINDAISAGVRVNVYGVNVLDINSTGFGADAGIMYAPFDFLKVGATIENIVKPYISLKSGSESLPQRYTLGAAGTLAAGEFTGILSADVVAGETEKVKFRAGIETSWKDITALRAGYDDGQISFGAGIKLYGVSLDYAYILNQYLGNLSVAGIAYSFGLSVDDQKKERAKDIREQVKKFVDEKTAQDMSAKADILYENAYSMYQGGKYEEALSELLKALEWSPGHYRSNQLKSWINERLKELYYDAGIAYYNNEEYIGAIESFKTLQKYDDSFRDSNEYMQNILEKSGFSGTASGYFLAGVDYYLKKQYNDAIRQWNKVTELLPDNKSIGRYILKAREALSATVKSVKKEITAADRKNSEALYYKAVDEYTSGNTAKAVKLWEEAIKANPENIGAQRDMEKAKIEIEELHKRGVN